MLAYPIYAIRYVFWFFRNLVRRLGRPPDYVIFTLEGDYPELPEPPRNILLERLRPAKTSLQELADQFQAVGNEDRVRGVILHLRPLNMEVAKLDSLRELIGDLKAKGKRVVAWSYSYDRERYYIACATDEILLLPGGAFEPLGLSNRYVFLAEALDRIGVKADIIQVSPYKSAGDVLMREQMSDEVREMANWLIDSTYAEFTRVIAEGKDLDEETAKNIIDSTPCTDLRAEELGAVDGLLTEGELGTHLGEGDKKASLATWESIGSRLLRRPPRRPGRYVALMSIEGTIVDGHSQRPPVDPPIPLPMVAEPRAGDLSVVQVVRQILSDKRAAAVVVYVNSRGGSTTASESIRVALEQIAAEKPLLISMGPLAASGGYLVSTPGNLIFAQPNTLTGSIGVLAGKIFNVDLLDRLLVNRETITRGQGAQFYDFERPFNEEEKVVIWEQIERIYDLFLERVSVSREMERKEVESISGGRVWTGQQALDRGLVDELGGLMKTIAKAREISGLSERAPVRLYYPEDRHPLAPITSASEALRYAMEGLRLFNRSGALCLLPWVDNV